MKKKQQQKNQEDAEQGEAAFSSASDGGPPATSWKTTIRQRITPLLPPPMVRSMRDVIDPYGRETLGMEETSITILLSTIVMALVLSKLMSGLFSASNNSGTTTSAIQATVGSDDDDHVILKDKPSSAANHEKDVKGTILLCGPPSSGKTSLIHAWMNGGALRTRTVTSIQPKESYYDYAPSIGQNDHNGVEKTTTASTSCWRCVDTPGHWGADAVLDTFFRSKTLPYSDISTVVVVVDSTQPVAAAADYLLALMTTLHTEPSKTVVACHKTHVPKAKNPRRLKLQLRKEVERLVQLQQQQRKEVATNSDAADRVQSLTYVATSVDPPNWNDLHQVLFASS